jgi:predicted ArsR family transcriptional regulator
MQTTRKRIMEYLETNRTASALELGRAFRMTGANLRHHLQILTQSGKIEVAGHDAPGGRGRPSLRYMTAKQAQGHSLADLSAALLEQVLGRRASKQRTQRLKQIARRLAGESGQPDETITQLLVAAVERLNALRYRSHWEAHTDGPRLILGQCPYAQIIDNYPELCQMDTHLLEGMLSERVTQTAKIDRRPQGPGACTFVVGPKIDNLD